MNQIIFITGNKDKFSEVQSMLPMVVQLNIDLPEIQSISSEEVIKSKLESVPSEYKNVFVEDVTFSLDCLNGLPGPLIKWFLKTIGVNGLFNLCKLHNNFKASTGLTIGFKQENNEINYFSVLQEGIVVNPRGGNGFGFDPIFQPNGFQKTLAEMSFSEKNEVSTRRQAIEKLKEYISRYDQKS